MMILFLTLFLSVGQTQEIVVDSVNLMADASSMKELKLFYKYYRTGKYNLALKELEKLEGRPRVRGNLPYFRAMCFKKLQKYEEANQEFKEAIKNGDRTKGIFYEYGQSLYAANDLEKAKKAFDISFKRNYKASFSLYYMAQISGILEDHNATKTNFVKIIEDKRAEKNILQVAYFQLAELIYSKSRRKFDPENYVNRYVVPLLDKALAVDPKSATAVDILKRKDEIQMTHNVHPFVMANGRKISRKEFNFIVTGEYSQDSNVTLATDLSSTTATEKSSAYSNLDVFTSRRWTYWKRLLVTPEFRLTYTRFAERNVPEIFQNDTLSYAPALRTAIEHKFYGKKASFLFDYEYNSTKRDNDAKQELVKFSDTSTIVLGQRVELLKQGDTTFKLKFESVDNFDDSSDSTSTIFTIDHAQVTPKGHLVLFLFLTDMESVQDDSLSTNSYLFRGDYLIPQMWGGKWGLSFGAALTFLDTKAQKDSRGLEKNFNPSGKLTRYFGEKVEASLLYEYEKNISKDKENNEYTKTIFGLEISYAY